MSQLSQPLKPVESSHFSARDGAPTIRIELPIKTGAGLNDRMHWRARSKRTKSQRTTVCAFVKRHSRPLPAVVTMTRLSSGKLDDDNLQGAFKAIRDGIADAFDLADNDPRFTWNYAQEKCKARYYGIRIEIAPIVREAVAPDLFGGAVV
jgi:hypothetical protein